jgi:hypothetical protein
MSAVIQKTVTVSADGKIEVDVPELLPGSIATITITVTDAPKPKRSGLDILRELPGHRLFHTVEEVDAYIREERDSWDDE